MSINHYSSDWWSHYVMESSAKTSSPHQYHHNTPTTTSFISTNSHLLHNSTATYNHPTPNAMFRTAFSFNLNNEDDEDLPGDQVTGDDRADNNSTSKESSEQESEQQGIPKEPMFEKPLTPSDVGKLNRLVIPKQHAEKHFPLNGGGGAEAGENGLLLSFEDEVGKSWRFRYSYWNSSQSYVLTKGWSRFVKEKKLDAGDIVVFARHRTEASRLFIGWRRRNAGGGQDSSCGVAQPAASGGGGGWSRAVFYSGNPYHHQAGPHSLPYQPECLHAGPALQSQTSGNSRTVRLFGVNLECQAESSEPSTPVGSPMSTTMSHGQGHHHQPYRQYDSNNNHMDISFSDVYRQG